MSRINCSFVQELKVREEVKSQIIEAIGILVRAAQIYQLFGISKSRHGRRHHASARLGGLKNTFLNHFFMTTQPQKST